MTAHVSGEITNWPTKHRLAEILRGAGLRIYVGQYSIRIEDFSHFVFQQYGGDRGDPLFDADADTVEEMMQNCQVVSAALASAGIRHRIEIYNDDDDDDSLAGYLHHEWPLDWNPPANQPSPNVAQQVRPDSEHQAVPDINENANVGSRSLFRVLLGLAILGSLMLMKVKQRADLQGPLGLVVVVIGLAIVVGWLLKDDNLDQRDSSDG